MIEERIPASEEREEFTENDEEPTLTDEETKDLLVELLQSYFPELTTSIGKNRNEDYIDAIREMEMEREALPFEMEDLSLGKENLPIQSRSEHDPLYERLERMDVKKPGPGFPPKVIIISLRTSLPSSEKGLIIRARKFECYCFIHEQSRERFHFECVPATPFPSHFNHI